MHEKAPKINIHVHVNNYRQNNKDTVIMCRHCSTWLKEHWKQKREKQKKKKSLQGEIPK